MSEVKVTGWRIMMKDSLEFSKKQKEAHAAAIMVGADHEAKVAAEQKAFEAEQDVYKCVHEATEELFFLLRNAMKAEPDKLRTLLHEALKYTEQPKAEEQSDPKESDRLDAARMLYDRMVAQGVTIGKDGKVSGDVSKLSSMDKGLAKKLKDQLLQVAGAA